MAGPADVLTRCTVLHTKDALGNHLPSVRADNVDAEDLVRLRIRDELDDAIRIGDCPCPGVGEEGELADLELDALLGELLLGLADPGHLGMGVDHRRDGVVVDVASTIDNVLGYRNTFLLGLVGEHGSGDCIADGIHVGQRRLEVLVGLDALPLVQLNTDILESKLFREGPASCGDEHVVGCQCLFRSALSWTDSQMDLIAFDLGAKNLGADDELHALLLQNLAEHARKFVVNEWDDAIQVFDDGHLGAEASPHGPHFKADDTAANDDEVLGHFRKGQGASGGHDLLLVNWDAGEWCDLRACGENYVFRLDGLGGAVEAIYGDLVGGGEGAPALHVVHLVLLEKPLDTACEASDGRVLLLHHGRQIQVHARHFYAQSGEVVLGGVVVVGRVQ
mmetsp:Transcript_10278/g.17967  ORF Transcript_10278/g.17967 Transcript_10278/m.17967 type:complete len:392 (-) Transcript_10278:310-1485(-)